MVPATFHHKVRKETMRLGFAILTALISTGTLFFHLIEGHTRFDSLYFVVITMATVGYGDIVPVTVIGKLLTMVYALTGVPLFIFMAGFMVEQRISGLVKGYVKHHTSQIMKLETELDLITENVEEIHENVEEIHENVEEIQENVEKDNGKSYGA